MTRQHILWQKTGETLLARRWKRLNQGDLSTPCVFRTTCGARFSFVIFVESLEEKISRYEWSNNADRIHLQTNVVMSLLLYVFESTRWLQILLYDLNHLQIRLKSLSESFSITKPLSEGRLDYSTITTYFDGVRYHHDLTSMKQCSKKRCLRGQNNSTMVSTLKAWQISFLFLDKNCVLDELSID